MGEQGLICDWHDKYRSLWGHQPIRLGHRLHKLDLFSADGLASLIESYPREHFSIVQTNDSTQRRLWREGELGGLSGREVIEAIGRGRLWLNMRRLDAVDGRYARLLEQLFDEMRQLTHGFVTLQRGCGLLISSPRSQVHYHADLPGQGRCRSRAASAFTSIRRKSLSSRASSWRGSRSSTSRSTYPITAGSTSMR